MNFPRFIEKPRPMRNCYISSTMREGPSQKPGVAGIDELF